MSGSGEQAEFILLVDGSHCGQLNIEEL
jgi:ribosome-binding protein aMBF1 (putative translation factor)